MKYLRYGLLIVVFGSLLLSCSKKKEEAARLEQEVLNQESSIVVQEDSVSIDTSMVEQPDVAAVPEEELFSPEMPKRPAGDGYTVQVASCEDEEYARHLVEVYTDRGYEPFVSEISIDGQLYHRVRVGMYESFNEANQLKRELEDKYTIVPWIDRVWQ